MNLSLEGKNAFVCGSSKGMGRAIAKVLAALGARIVLIARNEAALREVQHSLEKSHGQHHDYICADFSEPTVLKKKVEHFLLDNLPIHILINNTGGPPGGKAIEAEPEAYWDAFSKHLICNQVLSQAVVPGMKKEGFGRIINIISTSVKEPIPGLGVSNTTRGAVASWAKTLAHELGPFGITVNNVLPGATKTQRLFSLIEADAQNEGKTIEEVEQALISEKSHGQHHDYICADFSEPTVLKKKVEHFLLDNLPIHILINNTGGPPGGKAIEAEPEAYWDAFSKHLICNQVLSQAVVPGMKKEGFGRIINIISTSVKEPIPGLGVSNTTRGAVASWAKTLAHELGPFGITVNNVLPGATKTQRLFSLIEADAQNEGKTIEEVEQALISEIPLRRFAEPAEVAQAVAFLASPAASYINGVSLPVDGGVISCL